MNVTDILSGHSKAMHSTWFHYKPDGLLFDCGENVAIGLSTKIYAVNTVLLGHGHLDHIMGLPGFFFIRSSAKGDNAKPLQVVFPKGERDILRLKTFIDGSFTTPHTLKFPVTWTEVEPGQEIEIGKGRTVKAFATKHDATRLTLGYRLNEMKKKLKPTLELAAAGGDRGAAIRAKLAAGEEVYDYVPRNVLTYTGDTVVQDVPEYDQAELLIHEVTFINREDVKHDSHSLLEDVLALVKKYRPKNLLLNHFSVRYSPAMCGAATRAKCKELAIDFPVWVQYGEHCWLAHDPKEPVTEDPIEKETT